MVVYLALRRHLPEANAQQSKEPKIPLAILLSSFFSGIRVESRILARQDIACMLGEFPRRPIALAHRRRRVFLGRGK